jgi:glycosyltransferase involved in cell wall biosynthesis
MKLIHIVPQIEDKASGLASSIPMLCDAFSKRGHDLVLTTLDRSGYIEPGNFRHETYRALLASMVGVSPAMQAALNGHAGRVDLLHSHSLWMMPNVYPSWAAASADRPLVISPHGTLSAVALRRSRWRKKVFWSVFQRRAVMRAHLLHAASEKEYLEIRQFGLSHPVAIVPFGVSVAKRHLSRTLRNGFRRVLFLGRIDPVKGIENLLRAWADVSKKFMNWELRMVGPGTAGYLTKLKKLARHLGLARVVFAGPRFGSDRESEFENAELFILPSFTENFGMSVAEALAHGLPVITTAGTPWNRIVERRCGWYVRPEPESLAGALAQAQAMDQAQLAEFGENGRRWMKSDFSWDHIALQMEMAYQWVILGGSAPSSIKLS